MVRQGTDSQERSSEARPSGDHGRRLAPDGNVEVAQRFHRVIPWSGDRERPCLFQPARVRGRDGKINGARRGARQPSTNKPDRYG